PARCPADWASAWPCWSRACIASSSRDRDVPATPSTSSGPCPLPTGEWRSYGAASQHNAHPLPVRIYYRHHPFFSYQGHIVRRLRRRADESYVVELSGGLLLAVPAWMLDAAACSVMQMEANPRIVV